MCYTIMDDNVEVAPIYRCDGRATKPTRPCKNHGLAIECLPTWSESRHKLQLKSFAVPIQGLLDHCTTDWTEQNRGIQDNS